MVLIKNLEGGYSFYFKNVDMPNLNIQIGLTAWESAVNVVEEPVDVRVDRNSDLISGCLELLF